MRAGTLWGAIEAEGERTPRPTTAAALTEYEVALKNAPMRLRGFYGAAKAAEASGDTKKARDYFAKLASLTRNADGDRPEVREAKQRLASK